MGQKERPKTPEDRIVEDLLKKIEDGDETLILRMRTTLEIDSETFPTENDIREFVKSQLTSKKNHARKRS